MAQLRLDALQPQLLADQLLLRAELGLLRGRELLVEGPDELADAGVHELGGQHGVDVHAGGGEAERDVGHRVAQRGGGVVGQRLGRVDEEAVRGVVGGGESAEGAAVQQHAELLAVGGVLQRLDAKQLGERRFGVRDGDLLDGDAVEQAAVVGQDELQLGLAVRKGKRGNRARGAGLLDDGGESRRGENGNDNHHSYSHKGDWIREKIRIHRIAHGTKSHPIQSRGETGKPTGNQSMNQSINESIVESMNQ